MAESFSLSSIKSKRVNINALEVEKNRASFFFLLLFLFFENKKIFALRSSIFFFLSTDAYATAKNLFERAAYPVPAIEISSHNGNKHNLEKKPRFLFST